MADRDHQTDRRLDGPVPVVEPTVAELRRRRSDARRLGLGAVVVLCIAAVAVPVAVRATDTHNDRSAPHRTTTRPAPDQATTRPAPNGAKVVVQSAVDASIAAGSFETSSVMSETNPTSSATPGVVRLVGPPVGLTLSAHGTINDNPFAMVASSNVGNLGAITSWVDGTAVWEVGGGNYGITSQNNLGAGAPLSGFSGSVEGTLGPREGAVAMMSLASPTGYLNLASQAVTSASKIGTSTVNGTPVTDYAVTIDQSQLVHRPDMTTDEQSAAAAALAVLQQQGYQQTTVQLGIDDTGLVRQAQTIVHFTDSGTVNIDTTYSDFGCAGTVVLPDTTGGPKLPVPTCSSPSDHSTTTATVTTTTT
ncbi:MAG: hypothetical protein ACLPVY_06635 [Acidimicrobiia bacterium]